MMQFNNKYMWKIIPPVSSAGIRAYDFSITRLILPITTTSGLIPSYCILFQIALGRSTLS